MSRKDLEKKKVEIATPKKAGFVTIGLFVLGLVGLFFLVVLLFWNMARQNSGAQGGEASAPASVSQSIASDAL